MACVDTSFIIDLMRNDHGAIFKKQELEKSCEPLTIASPTIIELIRGLESFRLRKNERNNINDFISTITTLSLDKKAAIKAGNLELELIKKGQKIDIEDVMIGAIAISNNEKLITKNTKHFARIKDLEYESY